MGHTRDGATLADGPYVISIFGHGGFLTISPAFVLRGANLALHRQHGIAERVNSLRGTTLLAYTMVSNSVSCSLTQPTSFSVFQSPLLGSLPHLAFQLVGFGFARVVGSTTVFTSAMLCPYVRFRTLQTTRGGLAIGPGHRLPSSKRLSAYNHPIRPT